MSDQNECVVPIEEVCAMKTDGRVESTSDPDQSTEIDNISPDEAGMDERVTDLEKLVEAEIQPSTTATCPSPPKTQKVPFMLRDRKNSAKYYEPRVVSIGNLHHDKKNLHLAEKYKPKLAAVFIKKSGCKTEALYRIINDRILELRDYYDEEVLKDYDNKTLSWILFLDGCSILMLIYDFINGQLRDYGIKTNHIAFTQQDLFLLENQIPFQVLRLLMNSTPTCFREELEKSIKHFIEVSVMAPLECKKNLRSHMDNPDPIHLLDLLHMAVRLKRPPIKDEEKIKRGQCKPEMQQSFRNVRELKAAGIYLKQSKSCSLNDMTFHSFCFSGLLSLPPLIMDDSTRPIFLNLIAYEGCPDNFRTNYEVTSYISFLDSLIDNANDVKEMRSANILHNLLGSDEEVASLFNEIATDLVPNGELYGDVKNSIQRHYERRWITWMAEAFHSHFSSPWTFFAFISALVTIALTIIQIWFGVFPRSHDPCSSCCDCTRKS